MATASLPELKERLVLPAVSSSYPTLGANYKQVGYEVNHASRLVRTGKHYYDSKAGIPEGFRMTTAGEELAIQLALEHSGNDPRKANIFDDLFARGSDKVYMWQWTETGLRVPKGMEASKYEIDAQGRKYWARIVLDGDKEALDEGKIITESINQALGSFTPDLMFKNMVKDYVAIDEILRLI